MGEEVIQVELQAWEWMGAVAQKIEKMRERVFEHKDIPEDYMPLMKSLYRVWANGEVPIYETKMEAPVETSVQNSLFDDKNADKDTNTLNGKIIVKDISESIKTE
jgi:hypothetical protein